MPYGNIGDAPLTRGSGQRGYSLWVKKVPLAAATTIAVNTPLTTPVAAFATIDSLVSAPLSSGTAMVSATIAGNVVTLASFDAAGAAVNFDKDVYLTVIGKY